MIPPIENNSCKFGMFGRKSNHVFARITLSETNVVSSRDMGNILVCWISEYALDKFNQYDAVKIRFAFRGSNETKHTDTYVIEDISMDDVKEFNGKICCLVKLRKQVGQV